MANNPQPDQPNQHFADSERLFHRVRRNNLGRDGKATLFAFALPDMSVNRESLGTPEETRKGFDGAEWAVVAFAVGDIPPRKEWTHIVQTYQLKPRHVPEKGNFPHSEIRVWRKVEDSWVLITAREGQDFAAEDADRDDPHGVPVDLLDPDFHLRWRKHIALASKMVLPCKS